MAACNGYFCIFTVAKRKSGTSRSLIKKSKYLITVLLPSSASTIMLMQTCFTYSRSMALFCDWANGIAVPAVAVAVPFVATATEVECVRTFAAIILVHTQHTGPISAV